jgi:hypothetical protein
MSASGHIRFGWIKFMYIYTIIGAGGTGLGMIFASKFIQSLLNWTVDEPIIYGIAASVFLAFSILSVFGLLSPLKFTPVLLLQLCYKTVWFIAIVLPMLVAGKFPAYGIFTAIFWLTYIVGDLIAIPFGYLFTRQSTPEISPISK